jgi:hypothetical protein
MKVVKIVFWPYHCVEEEETKPLLKTASQSDVGNRRTRHHAPAKRLSTRTDARHASHASSSPGWADPTRIPDDPTHVPDPDKDDVIMTPVYTVSRHVSVQSAATSSTSQQTRQLNGTHLPRHQLRAEPRRAELSRAELENWSQAEPRAERQDPV